ARDGARDAARQVPPEQSRDEDAAERRDREPLEQRDQLMVQLRLRLGNDQVAEHRPFRLELQWTRNREVRLLGVRRRELERDRPARTPIDRALRKALESDALSG